MADLVTIDQARSHLRTDTAADDIWLETWIPAVSGAVLSWLKQDWRAYVAETDAEGNVIEDSNGDPIPLEDSNGPVVKPVVKAACLIEIAWQYRFREGDADHVATGDLYSGRYGYILSRGATALLNSLRKSTVA